MISNWHGLSPVYISGTAVPSKANSADIHEVVGCGTDCGPQDLAVRFSMAAEECGVDYVQFPL